MSNHEYVETYLKNLPPELRPDGINEKLLEPLREAWRNKWDARDLAKAVSAGNYSTSTSPVGSAIYRLTQIAKQKPYVRTTDVYVPRKRDPSQNPAWAKERIELIMRIGRENIPPDEAERLMQELIDSQRHN